MYTLNEMYKLRTASARTARRVGPRRHASSWLLSAMGVATSLFVWHAVATSADAGEAPASYTVHPGDTVWSIAERLVRGGDPRPEMSRIIATNHLNEASPVVSPGEVLLIPKG